MVLRNLTQEEITRLQAQGCSSTDWQRVKVASGFKTDYIQNVRFSGDIELGIFDYEFILEGGLPRHAGLFNVTLHNCRVGNNVLIENIHNYIANYRIGENCFIQNANLIVTEGRSSFGNGTLVAVLNETGGREVPIFNELSAHLAYIIALYRHFPVLTERLKALIERYTEQVSSTEGKIGNHVRIINTGTIRNVCIGDYTTIEGTSRLKNGSINSNAEAPVFIGHNVMAEDFIFSSGTCINDGAALVRCFIGQACHLGHLFSAHDSLFFSNCQGENGEACAVFAGPYTVTMHKSSLLIAGMFSFLNAGSGSNQSNHLYKLGPIHQGIVEQNNQTYLVPAVNLRSVGTIRDAQKWPKRDKRKDSHQLDYINFNLLSPYTIQKMLSGIEVLRTLQQVSGETSEEYSYQSAHIKSNSLKKGIQYYSMAINKFLGNSIIKRLENLTFHNNEEIRQRLAPTRTEGSGEWVDLSGLIVPQPGIIRLIRRIENGEIESVGQITDTFRQLHADYYQLEWTWAWEVMQPWYRVTPESITAGDVIRIVNTWKEAVVNLDKMLYEDAKKEFSMTAQTGFGADGNQKQKKIDFEQVRGAFENNPFVETVQEHIKAKTALGDELIERLKNI